MYNYQVIRESILKLDYALSIFITLSAARNHTEN